ncbi:MAG: O-antigen ligase family protein [Candidatus Hydrogenedentales bacterium]
MDTENSSDSTRTSMRGSPVVDTARGLTLCFAILATAGVYSVHLESFLDAKAAALGICLIGLGALSLLRGRLPWEGLRAYGLLAAFYVVSIALHVVRSDRRFFDFPYETLPQLLALAFAILSFDLLKRPAWRARLFDTVILAAFLVSMAAFVQAGEMAPAWFPTYGGKAQPVYSVFGNSNLLGGFLAMALPLLVWRMTTGAREDSELEEHKQGLLSWFAHSAVLLAVVAALGLSGSRGAWIAACAGCLVVILMRGVHPVRVLALSVLAPLALFSAVYVAPGQTIDRVSRSLSSEDSGGNLRLWFWDGTCRMIRDHWLIGTGLGTFAFHSPFYMGEALWADGGDRLAHNELLVEDPHCTPLLILAETGVVGALFWAAILIVLVRCSGPERGSLAAFVVVACVSFPLRSPPHALFALLLAGSLLARGNDVNIPASSRWSSATMGGASLVLALAYVVLVTPGSYLLRYAQDVHLSGAAPFDAYEEALAWPLQRPGCHEKYGIALLQARRNEEARRQFEQAHRGLDTGGVRLALGQLAFARGDGHTASAHFEAVVWRWPENAAAWKGLLACSDGESREHVLARARRWLSTDRVGRIEAELAGQNTARGSSSP